MDEGGGGDSHTACLHLAAVLLFQCTHTRARVRRRRRSLRKHQDKTTIMKTLFLLNLKKINNFKKHKDPKDFVFVRKDVQ